MSTMHDKSWLYWMMVGNTEVENASFWKIAQISSSMSSHLDVWKSALTWMKPFTAYRHSLARLNYGLSLASVMYSAVCTQFCTYCILHQSQVPKRPTKRLHRSIWRGALRVALATKEAHFTTGVRASVVAGPSYCEHRPLQRSTWVDTTPYASRWRRWNPLLPVMIDKRRRMCVWYYSARMSSRCLGSNISPPIFWRYLLQFPDGPGRAKVDT